MVPLGNPNGKAIVYQLGLEKECYEKIEVDEPDDLKGCFDALSVVEKKIAERFGDEVEVIANYTGGTKSMSAALVLKAIQNEDWKLSLNKGIRKDLIKVHCGDVPVLEDKLGIYLDYYIDQIKYFCKGMIILQRIIHYLKLQKSTVYHQTSREECFVHEDYARLFMLGIFLTTRPH